MTNYKMNVETSDTQPTTLESSYPQYDRLAKGWKLLGFANHKNTGNGRIPVYQYTWPEKSKYSCEKLRQLRAERGVGKRKKSV